MKYGIGEGQDETTENRRGRLQGAKEGDDPSMAEAASPATMASPGNARMTGIPDGDAVVFSIQFYGKTIGEVGLMDQDLSELDWQKFKSYLLQNLLSVNQLEKICVTYSDEEGDKLPIESDEEYREALKVAKKKAEMHDKMVLDVTRQGGLPTVLSFVSSGIKKVGSSPPKEKGMSFFKPSSPPKESNGFMAREWKPFSPFFLPEKGPIPGHVQGMWGYDCDEALECDKPHHTTTAPTTTTTTTTTAMSPHTDDRRGPPIVSLRDSAPNLLFKFAPGSSPPNKSEPLPHTSVSQGVFGAGTGGGAKARRAQEAKQRLELPPPWFTAYMEKFREEICEDVSERVMGKVADLIKEVKQSSDVATGDESKSVETKPCIAKSQSQDLNKSCRKARAAQPEDASKSDSSVQDLKGKKKMAKCNRNESGAKRKKILKEEERLVRKQEKHEKKKLMCKYVDELDKASRTQEKVLAKMEGLRKKQSCSPEELNKLRKMVDKQHRVLTAEQRQQRRNDRKASHQRCGKQKKFNIDNKGFPVDASLLHAALQELEALAEDSPNEGAVGGSTRGYDALYLHDVTYPDGSEVAPGTEFVKTWRVANTGLLSWNEKTMLCKWSQVRFRGSPAGWKLKPSSKKVVCPPLEPGQEGDISITFTAPSEPGWYATHWRFCQRGRVFGNQMWCAIHVADRKHREKLGQVPADGIKPSISLVTKLMAEQCVVKASAKTASKSPSPSKSSDSEAKAANLAKDGDLACGIVENYYDVEDPFETELRKNLKTLSLFSHSKSEVVEEKPEQDLILFEEEAEVVSSGTSTPEMIQEIPQAQAVVPLKEMAKESVESLRSSVVEKDRGKLKDSPTKCRISVQPDTLSISSGSFSELDSEDQAILNESDTEYSDNEYCVVHLPECFNAPPPYNGLGESLVQDAQEGNKRESPDFLTADEDDRTTAVASDTQDDQLETICGSEKESTNSNGSECSQMSTMIELEAYCQEIPSKVAGPVKKSPLPGPPPDTKPFMDVPAEALKANIAVHQQASADTAEVKSPSETKEGATWTSNAAGNQRVVCEQPASSQHKEPKVLPRRGSGAVADPAADLPVDLVSALPDELVSIIPEDLVRGAWNTARSFITRINQEMMSPDSPGHEYSGQASAPPEDEGVIPEPQDNATPNTKSASEVAEAAPIPPLLQKLEDMGFSNREMNKRLLTKYNNDVSCAVAELIVLNCQ